MPVLLNLCFFARRDDFSCGLAELVELMDAGSGCRKNGDKDGPSSLSDKCFRPSPKQKSDNRSGEARRRSRRGAHPTRLPRAFRDLKAAEREFKKAIEAPLLCAPFRR